MTIKLPDECCRELNDCVPLSQIVATEGGSFVCCGLNDGSGRKLERDKFTVCFKNKDIDELTHWDEIDLADHASVLVQALSIMNHVKDNEKEGLH